MSSSSDAPIKIAMAQMCSTNDPEHNFATVARLVNEASEKNVALVSFPECFEFMGTSTSESTSFATSLHSPLFERYCELAARNKIWISYGGYHEKPDDGVDDRICNAHVLVDSDGKIVCNYRKTHLFDVDIPDGKFHESSFTRPGEEMIVVKGTPALNIGLTTCYDLRFPTLFQRLRENGAGLILVPSAFMRGTGKAHWEVLLRARAIENQCYVAAAGQMGDHNDKRSSYGHSIIIDPWGEVVAAADGDMQGLIIGEITQSLIDSVRAKMPVMQHHRDDLYASNVNVIQVATKHTDNLDTPTTTTTTTATTSASSSSITSTASTPTPSSSTSSSTKISSSSSSTRAPYVPPANIDELHKARLDRRALEEAEEAALARARWLERHPE